MASKFETLQDTGTGEVSTHAPQGYHGNYATLCGCSDDDDMFERIPTPCGQKIDCDACRSAYLVCKTLRASDFEGTTK